MIFVTDEEEELHILVFGSCWIQLLQYSSIWKLLLEYSSMWKLLDPTARVEVFWQVQPRGVSAQSEVELRSKRESDKSSLHLILLPVIYLLKSTYRT